MASYIDKLLLLGVILLPIGVGLIFLIWAWGVTRVPSSP